MIEINNPNLVSSKDQTQQSRLETTSQGTLQGRKFDESTNKIPSQVSIDILYDPNLESSLSGNIITLEADLEIILCKKLKNPNEVVTDFEFDEINAEISEMLDDLCSKTEGKIICLTEENEIKLYEELTPSDKAKDQVLYTTSPDGTLNLFFNDAEQAQRFKKGSTQLKFRNYLIPANKQDILKQILINSLLQLEEHKQNKNKESDNSSHISKDNHLLNEIKNIKIISYEYKSSSNSTENKIVIGLSLEKLLEQLQIIAGEMKLLSEKKKRENVLEKEQIKKREIEKDILNDKIRADEIQRQVIKFRVKRILCY